MKGFGAEGPYASYNSFEMIAQAMGGIMSLTGSPDGPPVRIEAGLGDTGAGLHAAIGILAALVQRQATGVGQRVEVAQQDVGRQPHAHPLPRSPSRRAPDPPARNRSPAAAPSNLYRCRPFGPNDYVFIHVANTDMWKSLARAIGQPELDEDPRFVERGGRVAQTEEIEALVEGWTEKRTKHEVMELLASAGVPCGAVLDSGEVLENEHLRGRGMIVDVEHPTRGRMAIPGSPIRLSASPTEVTRAPLLGEHNAEVYGRLLDLGEADLAALRRDGVV